MLHWCIDQAVTSALAEMELTASQGHIMGFLSHQTQPPCARDVEEAFHMSHPTVSGLLSRLEQKGFIHLETDPHDRRCKRIYIQPKGQDCHQIMQKAITRNEERLLKDFTPEEKQQFAAYLQRAIANMGASPCHTHSKEEKSK